MNECVCVRGVCVCLSVCVCVAIPDMISCFPRFAFLRGCGCVFSEKALKEVPSENCHKVRDKATMCTIAPPVLLKMSPGQLVIWDMYDMYIVMNFIAE